MERTHSDLHDSHETGRLLEKAAAGDLTAFDALFARNREPLRQLIELRLDRKLKRRVDPSDVIQETHVAALRRFDDFLARRPMAFRLWLEKTARERLVKLRRRHRLAQRRSVNREARLPEHTSLALAQRLCARPANPRDELARRDLLEKVREGLARLAETDREILLMRYLEHRNNQEIAQILDMKSDAVSRRHGRALLKLAKLLEEGGVGKSDL